MTYNWNNAFNFFLEVKNAYIAENGDEKLYAYDNSTDCLHYWNDNIVNKDFNNILSCLAVKECGDLVLLRYNGLGNDFEAWDGLLKECRTTVIDKKKDALAITSFKKFFNINEKPYTQLGVVENKIENANCVEFSKKLDGSMIAMRWYNGKLVVCSSKNLDKNESDVLKAAYKYIDEEIVTMCYENQDMTFIFELIDEINPIVVCYKESQYGLYLIGMRNVGNGQESFYGQVYDFAEHYNVLSTSSVFFTFDELINEIHRNDISGNDAEGYVINVDGERYKLKYDTYVMLHRSCSLNGNAYNQYIKAVQEGYDDDLIAHTPDARRDKVKECIDNIKKYVFLMTTRVNDFFNGFYNETETRKEFVMKIKADESAKEYFGYLMNKYNGKDNDYLQKVKYGDILEYLAKEDS